MNVKYKEGTKIDTATESPGAKYSALTRKEILELFKGRKFDIILFRSYWW